MANRRTRSAAIRRSFAQGIRGSAAMPCCLTNPARTTTSAARPAATRCTPQVARPASTAAAYLRHVFLKCAASRGAQKSALTEVVPALRRPRWSATVRRRAPPKRLRDVDCAMRTPPRQDCNTRSPAQNLIRPCEAIRNRRGRVQPTLASKPGLECPASTTARRKLCHLRYEFTGARVSGCGTGHIHCGGQTGR